MPRGQFRSGRFRKVFVRTPGSRTVVHYRERKPKKAHCSGCGRVLPGVPRERPSVLRTIPKSSRRPERPYGGVLCSRCLRELLRQQSRSAAALATRAPGRPELAPGDRMPGENASGEEVPGGEDT